jgi:RNA polymerase sigma-70 factor (sigma-E family)
MVERAAGAEAPEVVDAVAAGGVDAADVECLWRERYPSLVRLARLLVDDRESAEEVVQDAFVRTFGRLHRVAPDRATAYLRSAVLNGARSNLRRRRVQRAHASTDAPRPSAPTADLAGHGRHEVVSALKSLPRRQREVLALRYYLDLTERDTADALGISVGSVKTHAHRGLEALAQLLEPTP